MFVCVCIVIIDVCLVVCVAITGTGIGGQITELGTGLYPGAAGYGSAAAPCCGGGGGFYSAGGTDTLYSFPGGQGFQQGGAGAIPASGYGTAYQTGGFGGGGTANYVRLCTTYSGDRLTDILYVLRNWLDNCATYNCSFGFHSLSCASLS